MPFPLTQPTPIERVEALLTRYDGPIPSRTMAAALHGDDAGGLRNRALSREIDRAARDLTMAIARHRAHLAASPAKAPCKDATMSELSRGLAHYRALGIRHAEAADKLRKAGMLVGRDQTPPSSPRLSRRSTSSWARGTSS